jgi:hypothetical protein
MRRIVVFIAAVVTALTVIGGAYAAVHRHAPAKRRATVHGLAAPSLLSPANGAHVEQIPALTWSSVAGAVEYQYQLSADPQFTSIVLGSGSGRGTATTHNLAATLSKSVTDGAYYWRVRGLTKSSEPGAWSSARALAKAWTAAPQLVAPAENAAVTWPTVPLVLNWTPVPYATEYIVTIATDPGLSNIVLGSATSPETTTGTVFALPGTLAAGPYYWAITPVDAEGHRGSRSRAGTFSWSWPTATSTEVADLNPNPQVFDPQFKWAPVPGAAHYEVEVNSAANFPVGSKWCCGEPIIGTSLSPTHVLANNVYYWRVRAVDAHGNAGVWNVGPSFEKAFDSVSPTIPNLTLSDAEGHALAPGSSTDTPIITWSPVPGAASYEVQITPYVEGFGCNWATKSQVVQTSSLGWTPLGRERASHIGPTAWPDPRTLGELEEGNMPYCARVLARSDNDAMGNQVISDWTQIGGVNKPAFRFANQPAPGSPSPEGFETPTSAYLMPSNKLTTPRTPLFTWKRVAGASFYYVVIARDAGFTHVVDIAYTRVPTYAPPLGGEEPLDDETTAYYWAVVPANANGEVFSDPSQEQDNPQVFDKASVSPTPIEPIAGTEVSTQPTFRWTPAEGALDYTLQVSLDPSFSNLIDNVVTDSTAYTSSSTYPADATLYWRVRANDTNTHTEGLSWTSKQEFRRALPIPSPLSSNPMSSEAIPALLFTPVTGATGYDVHVEEPDGSTKNFTVDSPAFAPTEWSGSGIWRWDVRAEFPTSGFGTIAGGYFGSQPLVHRFGPPGGVSGIKAGSRIVISWASDPYAKDYEAAVSTTDTFTTTIDSATVDGTSWAPDANPAKYGKQTLFWRVAAIDKRNNVGPFAMGSFVAPKPPAPRCSTKRGKHAAKKCRPSKHKKHH